VHEKVRELGVEYSQGYYIGEPKAEIQIQPVMGGSVNNIA